MKMKNSKSKERKVKDVFAYQVVDLTILRYDKEVLGLIFNPSFEFFSEAIFRFEDLAQKYADRLNKGAKIFGVIPVKLSYSLPKKK